MQRAHQVLKLHPNIQLETGHYQINPIYNQQQDIIAWRGQQSLA